MDDGHGHGQIFPGYFMYDLQQFKVFYFIFSIYSMDITKYLLQTYLTTTLPIMLELELRIKPSDH